MASYPVRQFSSCPLSRLAQALFETNEDLMTPRDNGARSKPRLETVPATPAPLEPATPAPLEPAAADTEADAETRVTVAGDKVTVQFRWKADKDGPKRSHTSTFDFAGVSREQLITLAAKAQGTAYVQGKLRSLAKTKSSITEDSFAQVHFFNHIISTSRGQRSALTPDQAIQQSLLNAGHSPEQVAQMIAAINSVKLQGK